MVIVLFGLLIKGLFKPSVTCKKCHTHIEIGDNQPHYNCECGYIGEVSPRMRGVAMDVILDRDVKYGEVIYLGPNDRIISRSGDPRRD
jgi:hypothetical protein